MQYKAIVASITSIIFIFVLTLVMIAIPANLAFADQTTPGQITSVSHKDTKTPESVEQPIKKPNQATKSEQTLSRPSIPVIPQECRCTVSGTSLRGVLATPTLCVCKADCNPPGTRCP